MTIDGTRAAQDLAELYRDLHRNPELSFQEERTAGIVAGRLRALGYETTTGWAGPAWSGCSATATVPPPCCGPTWTPCRCRRRPLPAGVLALRPGPAFAGADSVRVRMFGRAGTVPDPRPRSTLS